MGKHRTPRKPSAVNRVVCAGLVTGALTVGGVGLLPATASADTGAPSPDTPTTTDKPSCAECNNVLYQVNGMTLVNGPLPGGTLFGLVTIASNNFSLQLGSGNVGSQKAGNSVGGGLINISNNNIALQLGQGNTVTQKTGHSSGGGAVNVSGNNIGVQVSVQSGGMLTSTGNPVCSHPNPRGLCP